MAQSGTPAQTRLVGPPEDISRRRDVFVFFDDADKLQAPHDARALMERFYRFAISSKELDLVR